MQLPETAALNPYCHVTPPFRTQVKGLASYLVPKVEVQVSAAFQSLPGSSLAANYTSAAAITAGLGRAPTGAINTLAINLVEPGNVFGDRINQIDLRIGKLVRFAGLRSQFSVDFYNALNSSAVQPTGTTELHPGGQWWFRPPFCPRALRSSRRRSISNLALRVGPPLAALHCPTKYYSGCERALA